MNSPSSEERFAEGVRVPTVLYTAVTRSVAGSKLIKTGESIRD